MYNIDNNSKRKVYLEETYIVTTILLVLIAPLILLGLKNFGTILNMMTVYQIEINQEEELKQLALSLGFITGKGKKRKQGLSYIRGQYNRRDFSLTLKNGRNLFIKIPFSKKRDGYWDIRTKKPNSVFRSGIKQCFTETTGDLNFDNKLSIVSKEPAQIRAYLNKKNRKVLNQLEKAFPDFMMDEKGLTIAIKYSTKSYIKSKMDIMAEFFEKITDHFGIREGIKNKLLTIIHDPSEPLRFRAKCMHSYIGDLYDKEKKVKFLCMIRNNFPPLLQVEAWYHLYRLGEADFKEADIYLSQLKDGAALDRVIEIIGKSEKTEYIEPLTHYYEKRKDNDTQIKILQALVALGKVFVDKFFITDFLIRHLSEDKPFVHLDILFTLLKQHGTVEAVEPLMRLADRDHSYQDAASQVISKIQSRLGSVEKGWVSISENKDEDGALSIAVN